MSESFLEECNGYLENIISEYCQLSVLKAMTDAQADRMTEILEKAETDSLLSFLIDEADHIIGHELDLIDVEEMQEEQGSLRQTIDQTWVDWLIRQGRLENASQVPVTMLKRAQARLKNQGFYKGEVDGIYGDETRKAFQQLEQKFHDQLRKQGLCSKFIYEERSLKTSEAIKLVKEQGINGSISDEADLLSLGTWLCVC